MLLHSCTGLPTAAPSIQHPDFSLTSPGSRQIDTYGLWRGDHNKVRTQTSTFYVSAWNIFLITGIVSRVLVQLWSGSVEVKYIKNYNKKSNILLSEAWDQ